MATGQQKSLSVSKSDITTFNTTKDATWTPSEWSSVSNAIPDYSVITALSLKVSCKCSAGNGNYKVIVDSTTLVDEQSRLDVTNANEATVSVLNYVTKTGVNAGALTSNIVLRVSSGLVTRSWSDIKATLTWIYTTPTFKISLTAGTGGTVSGAGTYEVGSSATIKATPNSGYRFVKWSDGNTSATRTITKTTSDISANVTNLSYSAVFEKIDTTCTINFKNADGSAVSTKTLDRGATLGTLPTVSRNGYTFVGWIPCAPAVKTDGAILDSYQYVGSNSYPLDTKYKYTDKFSIHIEAYMSNWNDIVSRQIISCTEGGGWGLGYQANNVGHGFEIRNGSGYKGIDLGFGTSGKFSNNEWYAFDIVFSNSTAEVYVDGISKGTTTISDTVVSYYGANTIFVGAEAGSNAATPAGNYFKGYISNVFIANQGTRLAIATTSTVVEGNVDYYPVWRLNTEHTISVSAENGSVSGGGTYEEGKTVTLTAIPNDGYVFKQWSDGNTDNPRTVTVTGDVTYTAEFESAMPEFTLVQMLYNNKQISKDNKVPAGQSFRLIAGVK